MEGDIQLLTALLNHPAAFAVDLFGIMQVYRLEDGRFSVTEEDQEEKFFPRAREAAEHFLVRRQARRLGFDYSAT